MKQFSNPLDHVRIAAPCSADWDQMIGSDRARFCAQCNLSVYNLSSMTRAEAEHLIASNEGRLCVRYYRRADGSILTENCPVGLRAIKRRLSRISRAITSAVLSFFAGIGVFALFEERRQPTLMGAIAVKPPVQIPAYIPPPPLALPTPIDHGPVVGSIRLQPDIIRTEPPMPLKVTRRSRE